MHIPKYWAKAEIKVRPGNRQPFASFCWGWSDHSAEEARQVAAQRAALMTERLTRDASFGRNAHDYYADAPLHEEIIQNIKGSEGQSIALVTRNSYGALVLNAAQAMFIDIDFPAKTASSNSHGGFGGLMQTLISMVSGRKANGGNHLSLEEEALANLRRIAAARPDMALRVYRTHSGLRALVTNRIFDPKDGGIEGMLRSFGSDPLYIKLCTQQECFRARLTPKPWRMGIWKTPANFPREGKEADLAFKEWETKYNAKAAGFSTCRFVETLGPVEAIHQDIHAVLNLHDSLTGASSNRPLA